MEPARINKQKALLLEGEFLKQKIREWGATLVGFGDVSVGLAPELKHMPVAVSIGIEHPRGDMSSKEELYNSYFPEIDRLLEQIANQTVKFLRFLGCRSLAIPPDSHRPDRRFVARLFRLFSHKTAVTCSGLGWIGKNGLVVTPEYGPRVSWATVLTDAPLATSVKPYVFGKCGKCRCCVEACPAKAIKDRQWVRPEINVPVIDTEACRQQLEKNYLLYGRYICGRCIAACPIGREQKAEED
ncbi:4Fe-4S double cluster binding domain-containing protein [Calderihabitans maritimus]|uniref:4Fe-4S ferredoxin n=1 Tax=Calderihabitans maritimus TaxID=1246530 RepID=A0A1Z5HNE8_9FIRM|nr:4Fe-4S double cluster binding domain-containing protein [Calderihabitans maritimus]GAW91052.1 4Fe-4S ferredoxin [Calderihabitans maritimus]